MNRRSGPSSRIVVNEGKLLGIRHIGHSRIKTGAKIGFNEGTPCFLRGTSVLTARGATRVEDLAVGDSIVTAKGTTLPVKWIGRRHLKKDAGTIWPKTVLPVCISRFALDEVTPYADLYLSPNHALFIDNVLIPAAYLVNGTTVVQTIPNCAEEIEYFHILLATHEVIFAEGAAVETLLVPSAYETFGNFIRDGFDNRIDYERVYRLGDGSPMAPCAPRICYNGGRSELNAMLRRAASLVVDIRNPIQVGYDRIAARAVVLENSLTPDLY